MGSALTVTLSITRTLNLTLLSFLLVNVPNIYILPLFIILFAINVLNYFTYPLPMAVELMLPYILLILIGRKQGKLGNLFYIGIVHLWFVYTALYPTSSFDKSAANTFWKAPFSVV